MASKKRRSKKLFDPNSPQPEATLFVDRNAGRKVAIALRTAGYKVEHHDDWFVADAADEVWLRDVGRKGWIVLTLDDRIRYRPLEKLAVQQNLVKMLVPAASGNLQSQEVIALLIRWLPKALRQLAQTEPPIILRIRRDGSLHQVELS